jgi:transposase
VIVIHPTCCRHRCDWLPRDHLARFVADIVDQLDLSALIGRYRGAGSPAYHPAMLLAQLIFGYATGTYPSRRIEQAAYDSLAFRYLAANTHPDHGYAVRVPQAVPQGN